MDLDPYRVNPLVAEAASDSGGSLLDRVIAFIGGSLKGRQCIGDNSITRVAGADSPSGALDRGYFDLARLD